MVAFLACVEKGPLEPMTVLLCRSIRQFAGTYRDSPIHTFRPRAGDGVSSSTREALLGLGVTHHDEVVNADFPDYPVGNKVFVCAHAERTLPDDVLVFLDSDTVMVGEPAELDLPDSFDAAARPAWSSENNSSGPGDPRDAYWIDLYNALGIVERPYVVNEFSGRVRAYFSSGLIAARRAAGLFRRWEFDFRALVGAGRFPRDGRIDRMDEVSLACTMSRCFDRVRVLDGRYNYLIYYRPRLPEPWRSTPLERLIHIHYRYWFNRPGFLRDVRPPIDPRGPVALWLGGRLPLEPVRVRTASFPFEDETETMNLQFACQCGHVSIIPAAAAGSPGRCVACRAVFQVPGAVRPFPGRVPPDLSGLAESWGRAASRWDQIPGMFDFEPVYDAAVARANDGAVFVEVGCLVGRSAYYLADKIRESGKAITLYAVETATGSPSDATGNLIAPALGGSFAGVLHRNILGCGLLDVVVPILTTSVRAARLFPDGGVDFCFIDGDHRYPSVTADLGAWWPKIRPGGTLAGHDYRQPDPWLVGVTPAVHDFFGVEDATDPILASCWSRVKGGAEVVGRAS